MAPVRPLELLEKGGSWGSHKQSSPYPRPIWHYRQIWLTIIFVGPLSLF